MIGSSPIKSCAQYALSAPTPTQTDTTVSALNPKSPLLCDSTSFFSPCPARSELLFLLGDISPPTVNQWASGLARSPRCSTGRACGRRRRTRSSRTSSSATAMAAGAPSPPRPVRAACILRNPSLSRGIEGTLQRHASCFYFSAALFLLSNVPLVLGKPK
jgi:hypothetical protein